MSFESWKAEFYPIIAQAAASSPESALAHSVQKWVGKLSHNRVKHGVMQSNTSVFAHGEANVLVYNADSCALCHQYVMREVDCRNCPITRNTGISCNEEDEDGNPMADEEGNGVNSAYMVATSYSSDTNILKLIAAMTGDSYDEVARRFLPPDGKSSILDSRIDV